MEQLRASLGQGAKSGQRRKPAARASAAKAKRAAGRTAPRKKKSA